MLPGNLVGRHAMSHLEWVLRPGREWVGYRTREKKRRQAWRRDEVRAALGEIVDVGAVGILNAELKERFPAHYENVAGRLVFVNNAEIRFQGGPDIDHCFEVAIKRCADIVLDVAARSHE